MGWKLDADDIKESAVNDYEEKIIQKINEKYDFSNINDNLLEKYAYDQLI